MEQDGLAVSRVMQTLIKDDELLSKLLWVFKSKLQILILKGGDSDG